MARRYYSSTAARTTLASGVDDTTTTFNVTAVSGWPASYPYTLIVDQDTVNEEIVEVSARSGTTLTVTRGVDGTSAVAHDSGAAVNHGVSGRDFNEPNAFLNDGTLPLVTAKGDILAGTADGTVDNLAVGTNGYVLRADSAEATGLEWYDLPTDLAKKVDYSTPVNAQTGTTYTFVADDGFRITTSSNASGVTFTIPAASAVAWPDETILRVVNYGAGAVTIDGGSGVTVTNTSSTIAQYGAAVAIRTGSDAWTVVPFGGGDVPSATVSSPAATGQYTDTGITYDYYTFTSSGTLTVDTAGFADVLVVAGGGGTRTDLTYPTGGGAGGMLELTDAYLPVGSLTVTVGAGGSSGFRSADNHGNDSVLDTFVGVGGGGGSSSGTSDVMRSGDSGGSGSGASSASFQAPGRAVTNQGNLGGTASSGFAAGGGAGGAASGGTAGAGKASSITGSSVTYAAGGASSGTNTANTGDAGQGQNNGNSGVVIVRVKV